MLDAFVLHELHFFGVRVRFGLAGVVKVEPVHPGDELGSDVVDEVARGKSVTVGCALHSVTSGPWPSQWSIQAKLEPIWAERQRPRMAAEAICCGPLYDNRRRASTKCYRRLTIGIV